MTKQLLGTLWGLCAVVACGSVSKDKMDSGVGAGDFALAVDTTSLSSGITGTATLNVTVMRDSALSDPIALTATGLPAGVTATFGAASLPAGTDTTTVTLKIDQAADAGTSQIVINGTAGSHAHMANVSLELHTATVTGTVRSGAMGVTVRLVGKAAVQTDATGSYTFTDVKVPYDIYVLGQGGTDNGPIPAVSYYKGLTRLDPVLTALYPACSLCLGILNNHSATFNGSRSGAGTNAGPTYVKFTGANGSEVNTSGTWGFTGAWFALGTGGTSGKLQGLQAVRGTAGAPTSWLFAESGTVAVAAGSTNTINLTLASLGTAAGLTGTITQPGGFPTPSVSLNTTLSGTVFEVWTASTSNGQSVIPVLSGQASSFYASSSSSGALTEGVMPGLAAATDITMTLPAPAGITGPVNNATNVNTTTPFEFTTSANQVYEIRMTGTTAIYFIYTTAGSITIPDVSEMPLPSAAGFNWEIRGYAPLASVDLAADTVGLVGVNKFEGTAGPFHAATTSPSRHFTTQ